MKVKSLSRVQLLATPWTVAHQAPPSIFQASAEAPILWPPDVKSQLIRKDPDAGKDWRQEEKGLTEDKMLIFISIQDFNRLEKTLESPLNSKDINPVNPKKKSTLNIHWKD